MTKIKIRREMDGHFVGVYDTEKRTYYKKLRGKIHQYDSPPSVCNDISILHTLDSYGCQYIHIYNSATRKHFWTTMQLVWNKGFEIPDYGYGRQWALPLAYWYPTPPPLQTELNLP